MLGDGLTSYPQGEDGEPHLIAGCTVNGHLMYVLERTNFELQASIRRRTNPTKLKLTFMRNKYLKVCFRIVQGTHLVYSII